MKHFLWKVYPESNLMKFLQEPTATLQKTQSRHIPPRWRLGAGSYGPSKSGRLLQITYNKIHSDTIISVNFCSNYKSELFISYSFGECKIICTVCAHNSYSYVLHYCYYFPLVTHAKFTFICTVFHRIFYRPGRDFITDKSFHVALLFLPLLIWQACSSMYNLCSISKSHHLMKKIWSFSVPL